VLVVKQSDLKCNKPFQCVTLFNRNELRELIEPNGIEPTNKQWRKRSIATIDALGKKAEEEREKYNNLSSESLKKHMAEWSKSNFNVSVSLFSIKFTYSACTNAWNNT
jgi:hypothetical protein